MSNIREPIVAGTFYPANPISLSKQVREFLVQAEPKGIEGEIKTLVSPHAGYIYSGGVAAYGYKLLEGSSYDLVAVISPSHRTYFSGLSIWDGESYRTPLGLVEVAEEEVKNLISSYEFVNYYPEAHSQEHALEVQLPFLQETELDGVEALTLEPMGDMTPEQVKAAVGERMVCLDLLPVTHFLTHYSLQDCLDLARRLIDLFAPRLILGVSDEISQVGDIARIEAVSELVEKVCGLAQ